MTKNELQPEVSEADHSQGSKDAALVLVEYGDYECPFCGEAYPQIKKVQQHFGKNLRFVFRNFPLSQSHPHAIAAAMAAEAAALQGKFWEMHDLLFENQNSLEYEDLMEYADLLKLNIQQFGKDLESSTLLNRIKDQFKSGVRSGVNGTPNFFVNGLQYDGSFYAMDMIEAIEEFSHREIESVTETIAP
jgi:protein-disulfide isomerase